METKFTKGEWTHRQNEIGGLMQSHFLIEGEERALPIAKVYSDTMNLEKALANAKLIAAAPDMFDALVKLNEEVIKMIPIGSDKQYLDMFRCVQKAIIAIKKATE